MPNAATPISKTRELFRALWRHRWATGLVAVAVLAGGYFAAQALLGPELPAYLVGRGELVQTVVASGRVETPQRIDIGSQVTGTVAAVPVAEGQTVAAGQLLIALENAEAKAAVEQARAAVNQALARQRQVTEVGLPVAQQALRQALANLENLRLQYGRTLELRAKGFVGQAQLDEVRRNLAVAESQALVARVQEAANRPDGSESLLAASALEQARASLRMAEARRDTGTIEAPLAGTLIARNVERGDVVQPGRALMVLSPAGPTQLVVQIDEKNLAALQPGLKALASADAYPNQRFAAELVYINPAVDPQRGSVEVKFKVPQAPPYLRQDMTVSVDILVAQRSNAMLLPLDALRYTAAGAPWVMKVVGGRAFRQPVNIGVRGTGRAEILSGLETSDQVLSASATGVSEGQRVRAQPRPVLQAVRS